MNMTDTGAGSVLALDRSHGYFRFDPQQCRAVGAGLHDAYVNADPFPHIVLDNFLAPQILERVVDEFPERAPSRFADSYSQLKTGYVLDQIESPYIQDLLSALNSAAFLGFLESLTGIKGLITDAHFSGGGLHETARGGHLSIHADFNVHPRTAILRRLNLILFLNSDWQPDYGGDLELWDRDMKACRKSVSPVLGRAVIFNTDTTSYHGHPEPLACPEDRYRRSIALYYYSAPTGPASRLRRHSTLFQPRAGTTDAPLPIREQIADRLRRLFTRH